MVKIILKQQHNFKHFLNLRRKCFQNIDNSLTASKAHSIVIGSTNSTNGTPKSQKTTNKQPINAVSKILEQLEEPLKQKAR